MAELKSIDQTRVQPNQGKRAGENRLFIDQHCENTYPNLFSLWHDMHQGEIKQYFESFTGHDYTGLYPRVEVISDIGDFYLEPHHDLLEKRLTALLYTDHEKLWPGTALGESHRVEAKDNRCMFFVPSVQTWHHYPHTHFDVVRRALQLNYWTYDV